MTPEYPSREQLDAPSDLFEHFQQELQYQVGPRDMALNLLALEKIYGKTKLYSSFISFSKRTALAGNLSREEDETTVDPNGTLFASGCLLVLHSVSATLDTHERRYLLSKYSYAHIEPVDDETHESLALRALAAEMNIREASAKYMNDFAHINPDAYAAFVLAAETLAANLEPSQRDSAITCLMDGMAYALIQTRNIQIGYEAEYPNGLQYSM